MHHRGVAGTPKRLPTPSVPALLCRLPFRVIIRPVHPHMACPACGSTAPMLQGRCIVCGASSAADAPTFAGDAMTGTFAGSEPGRFGGMLNVGQNFGTRYHIIRLLGTGGMGAVY